MTEPNDRLALLPFLVRFDKASGAIDCEEGVGYDGRSGKRTEQMRGVLRDPGFNRDEPFYSFYENFCKRADIPLFQRHGLRYDLIVVYPGVAGEEFKKTSGHYHSKAPDGAEYPEIYEVLQGEAVFVLQKCAEDGTVEEARLVRAVPGDKLLIPPGYGHATVNIGSEPLVFADLVAVDCRNTYGQIAQNRGMSCHVLRSAGGGFSPAENPAYGKPPPALINRVYPAPARGLERDVPLYKRFVTSPALFDYLTHPAVLENDAHTFDL